MGQRHQLYIKTHNFNAGKNESKTKVTAFHSQWLYGSLPLRALLRLLKFNDNAEGEYKLTNKNCWNANHKTIKEILEMILTVNYEDGMVSNFTDITHEFDPVNGINPLLEDNNDGITLVDFTLGEKPGYAFMDIHGINEHDSIFEPLSAEDYLKIYYKVNGKEWVDWELDSYIDDINTRSILLTTQQIKKIIPGLYTDPYYIAYHKEKTAILEGPRSALPTMIKDDIHPTLQRKFEERLAGIINSATRRKKK